MVFVRFRYNGKENEGVLEGDKIKELSGGFYGNLEYSGNTYKLSEVRLLAPCRPSKVVAVGLNYVDHIRELGNSMPKNPVLFIKLPHTVIGPDDSIVIPEGATRVDYEAELAIVIKKLCRRVRKGDADEYILGATCLNDVTERDVQKADGQWTRAKNYDTFCPIGPYIITGIDCSKLDIKLILNGEIKQHSNTSNLLWNTQELVSFISGIMPLYPGDVVTTGTPYGVSPIKKGDIIEVIIEGIGTLRNPVAG